VIKKLEPTSESPLKVVLLQGVSRGERMDYAIQKAVELGVHKIVPIVTERCNVQMRGERSDKKRQHWNGVITSACEQSGRSYLPDLGELTDFRTALDEADTEQKLILHPESEKSFSNFLPVETVSVLIGPEGGFSDEEIQQSMVAGFTPVSFGTRILRTETASTAVIAVLQSLWGDLK
jgi:16S rRNA (uracil1498-N3)-methyltransferase